MNKQQTIMTALALAFGVAVTTPAVAGSCAGGAGTVVVGKDDENYCLSGISMNWWSAFAWCEAAGGTLVSLDDCNGKNGDITGEEACPNFKFNGITGNRVVCTSSCYNPTIVYTVALSTGVIYNGSSRTTTFYALCKGEF